jgi:putative thioredoxin
VATVGLTEAEREAVERLEREVIHPSMTALVILDFWSDRSAVSKQLSLTLEKIVADYAAKGVVLTKIDVDQDKVIAAQFRIQSIPTVYAIYRGQPLAELTEFRTEAQLKRALDQLLSQLQIGGEEAAAKAEIEPLVAMAEQVLADGDAPRAVSIFRQIRDMAPDNPVVIGGLVRALAAAGETDEARGIVNGLSPEQAKKPEIARAKAALEIASAPPVDIDALEARLAADPDDHQARFELAVARSAAGERDAAADALLEIVGRDREWNEGAARARFLQLLEAQGLADPWSREQRRRLSALLFT